MRLFALALAAASAFAADWKIDSKVAKDAKANFNTTIAITVADAKGAPVSGAEVEAVLTMADMDHGEVKLAAKQVKPGVYETTAKFFMVGAWNIEVRAKKGNETASKKFRHEIKE